MPIMQNQPSSVISAAFCIWMGLQLQTPFSHFLFITLMHSLTRHIQTLSDSFTHTHAQILSLQSISCCPNKSTVGARSLPPIWPAGLRETSNPPFAQRPEGSIVFPVRVKNGEFCSATQEPRSGNFLIPLLPQSYSHSCALKHHTARGRPTPPTMEMVCFANTAAAVGAYLPGGAEPQARNHTDRLFSEKTDPRAAPAEQKKNK